MFSKLVFAAISISILISTAQAGIYDSFSEDKFFAETAAYARACQTDNSCQAPFRNEVVYSRSGEFSKLGKNTVESLKEISFVQAQIWGDTILEGDYAADGETRLEKVLAIFNGDNLIGYHIEYSEKAWYTGNCEYSGQKEQLLKCTQGRISERSYVSADLEYYGTDYDRTADFAFDKN